MKDSIKVLKKERQVERKREREREEKIERINKKKTKKERILQEEERS